MKALCLPGGMSRDLIFRLNFLKNPDTMSGKVSGLMGLLEKNPRMWLFLTVFQPEVVPFGQLDFDHVGKNFQKYYDIGYNLLSKPTVQYRRVLEAGKPQLRIYH